MNINSLHSNHWHFSGTQVVTLRVVFKTVQWYRHTVILFVFCSQPWGWSQEWPKHMGD